MKFIIAYDVSDDDLRRMVAERLLDEGASRIQYSVFELECSPSKIEELFDALRRMIGDRGRLLIIPVCRRDEKRRITIILGDYRASRDRTAGVII